MEKQKEVYIKIVIDGEVREWKTDRATFGGINSLLLGVNFFIRDTEGGKE